MSEYIKREDVIDAIGRVDRCHMKLKGTPMLGACALLDEINDLPSTDVVEVVRCKDCKYWNTDGLCKKHSSPIVGAIYGTDFYDYCSEGERKEQEHERG